MGKPTVRDIAKEAGVSLASVDRVLNERAGVRETTIAKVKDAVERLGYVRDTHAANLARQRQYRFAFVLPQGPSQFTDTLRSALSETSASQLADRVLVNIINVPSNDPHATVRSLQALDAEHLDGVAIMVPETPQVRDAIARLKVSGLAIVALVSDLPNSPRDYFIGIDNVAAGGTAAQLMGWLARATGQVLVVTNSMRSRDSLERRLGFDAVMARDFPTMEVLPSVESYDDPERMEHVVRSAAFARPFLSGVYSMGTGSSMVLRALRASGRLGEVAVIAHELTPNNRQALIANEIAAVIAQNVGHLVRSSVRVLRSLCDGVPVYEAQEKLRIDVVLRENLH